MTVNWEEEVRQPSGRRGHVQRMFVAFTIATLAVGAVALYAVMNIVNGNTGYIVMFLLFGFITCLTGYWALAYLRDLRASPVVHEGEVLRKWIKGQILEFFWQACYIKVEKKIYVIPRLEYSSLLETDLVRIRCYPHSLTVETIERYDEIMKRYVLVDGGTAA